MPYKCESIDLYRVGQQEGKYPINIGPMPWAWSEFLYFWSVPLCSSLMWFKYLEWVAVYICFFKDGQLYKAVILI